MADPRITWTPGALSHDRGGRESNGCEWQVEQPSGVRWTRRMREAAFEVMALPVPRRDEPGACSGVIERKGKGR